MKKCECCSQEFKPKKKTQKYCSQNCALEIRRRAANLRAFKKCLYCDSEFSVKNISKNGKEYSDYAKKFCGKSCAASYNNKGVDRHSETRKRTGLEKWEKAGYDPVLARKTRKSRRNPPLPSTECIVCGEEFAPKRINSKRCKECLKTKRNRGILEKRRVDLERWMSGDVTGVASGVNGKLKPFYREAFMDKYSDTCQECGDCQYHPDTGRSVNQVDHMDGNSRNNHVSNLQVLCPNCHALTANYCGMNRNSYE